MPEPLEHTINERAPRTRREWLARSRPRAGEGLGALNSCLTGEGKKNLNDLIARLRASPDFSVQLVGRASPEGDFEDNMDLGERRALMVKDALAKPKKGAPIDASRIGDAPGASFPAGCRPLGRGLKSCGAIGSSGPRDRQVTPTVFAFGISPEPGP